MKSFLMIENDGELDTRAITLIGASSKRGSAEAIGMFGSGFSYTVGTLLRRGLEFHIFSGEREILITTSPEVFRGVNVNVIYVNGERTSLTAEIGPKWTEIECVRELWSNALDEGGAFRRDNMWPAAAGLPGREGTTRVYVEISPAIRTMLDSWQNFFIDKDEKPLHENRYGSIYPITAARPSRFYRRGVWCTQDRDVQTAFIYNLQELNLPESRLVGSGTAIYAISDLLSACPEPEIVETLINRAAIVRVAELRQIYNGSVFATATANWLKERNYQFIGDAEMRSKISHGFGDITFWCHHTNVTELIALGGLPNVMMAIKPAKQYKERVPLSGEIYALETMVARFEKAGINIAEFPVIFAEVPDNIIAYADMEDGKIVLSEASFRNDDMLFKSLIEEYIHLKFKCRDLTVEQQHAYLTLMRQFFEAAK